MSNKHPFRFGCINEQMKPGQEWRDHVRKIEGLGYGILFMRDHFLPDVFGGMFGPIAALMSAADSTTRPLIGSMVICNDFRHPAVLAKEAATIDFLSGGRFELGLGAGWMRAEYEQMGIELSPASVRIKRLEESIGVIKGLLGDSPYSQHGGHYTITNLNGFPKPIQSKVPIMVGGGNKNILTLAGRTADIVGILLTNVASGTVINDPSGRLPEGVMQKIQWVKDGAGEKFEEVELNSAIDIVITNDRYSATKKFIEKRGWQGVTVEQVWSMPSVFIGTTEQVIEEMYARRETFGFSYYWVSDDEMGEFAPFVKRLTGK